MKAILVFLHWIFTCAFVLGDSEPKVGLYAYLMMNSWRSAAIASATRIDLKDEWLGGPAFGLKYKESDRVVFDKDLVNGIKVFLGDSRSISTSPKAPWDGDKGETWIIFNEKNRPIFSVGISRNRKSLRIKQLIKVAEGVARFSFGDENLIYLEVESNQNFPSLHDKQP